jgi:FdhE protein
VKRPGRGGPADFATRLARAEALIASGGGESVEPLRLLAAVLRYQAAEAEAAVVAAGNSAGPVAAGWEERLAAGRFPLLDLDAAVAGLAVGIAPALAALDRDRPGGVLPEPLAVAARALAGAPPSQRVSVVESWLDDPAAADPRLAFWVRVAAGPVLETARAAIDTPSREDWAGAACPACGGPPQASVIAEESGEFMGGSPRSLVCGRCAGWWTFARATCPWCAEDDPRRLAGFVPDGRRVVRVDACETCRGYVKTFDLRALGGVEVVPLVDDVATLTLDVWAHDHGFHRPLVSFAGV